LCRIVLSLGLLSQRHVVGWTIRLPMRQGLRRSQLSVAEIGIAWEQE
jgi:hypothetical protein